MRLNLSGKQCTALASALRSAYSRRDLAHLLKEETHHELDAVAASSAPDDSVFASVIQRAEQMGWSDRLVLGASAQRGDDPLLAACLFELGLSAASPIHLSAGPDALDERLPGHPIHALRRAVKLGSSFSGFEHFLARLGELDAQICRIELQGACVGTGLLVADDLVLTSEGVKASISEQPASVRCRFDYRALAGSASIRPGQTIGLTDDPRGACGSDPMQSTDSLAPSSDATPLDFALLRLAAPVGRFPPGLDRESGQARRRGYVPLRGAATPRPGREILVMAHADSGPIGLALSRLARSSDARRFDHGALAHGLVGTCAGGAPCFNPQLELVGVLGMAGATASDGSLVSITAIIDHLAARDQLPGSHAGESRRIH